MSRCRRTALLALVLTVLAPLALAWYLDGSDRAVRANPASEPPAPAPAPAVEPARFYAGNTSCSARGCHGGIEPNLAPLPALNQNEYTRWTIQDKHRRAFAVLESERGQRIAKNLAVTNPDGKVLEATRDVRCLACHATPQLAATIARDPAARSLASDGVGCEACHGPAVHDKSWLEEHTRATWTERKKANAQGLYAEYHMNNLGDLHTQATVCAGCHIGAPEDPDHGIPARDLNHDLMAAGHPRLTFELTSFRDNMPPHWRRDKYASDPGYEARSWAVGQVASAQASVALLHSRASRAQDTKHPAPWPEFAEADCFSCHARLRVPSWRGAEYRGDRPLGVIPYSTWYTVMLPFVAPESDASKPVAEGFEKVRQEMNRPFPDPKAVVTACDGLKAPLTRLTAAANQPSDSEKMLGLIRKAFEPAPRKKAVNWDDAEQVTMAVAALSSAAELGKRRTALEDLWTKELAFPGEADSPADFRTREFENRWSALLSTLPASP